MNKWAQVFIGAVGAGATQAGLLYAAGITQAIPLILGAVGSAATTAVGVLKQLPQREWSDAERAAKLGKE